MARSILHEQMWKTGLITSSLQLGLSFAGLGLSVSGKLSPLTCVGKGVLFMKDLFICLFMYVVLGMVPRTSHVVDKPSITELRF